MIQLFQLVLLSALVRHATLLPVRNCECGIENISSRIIGGSKSPVNMFPWLVYIETVAEMNGYMMSQSCTGSIISDKYVLTAAHCLHPEQKAANAHVWLMQGCGKKRKTALLQPLKVAKIFKHPNYDPEDDGAPPDDLSIFELKYPLKFNQTFMPVCLSKASFTRTRDIDNLVAAGWGKTKGFFSLKDSDCLQHADLDVVSDKECKLQWGGDRLDMKKTMCAGGKTNICDGDSGGPLMTRRDGRVFQVGITSFGRKDCGMNTGTPSGFERVSAHLDWIRKVASKGQGVCYK